jgi:hypothetical protein
MKAQNGELDTIAAALGDLGQNRMPYPVAVRLHNIGKSVRVAISDREALRLDLVKPYLLEGKLQVEPEDPGYVELVQKIGELFSTEVEVNTGDPIDLSRLNGTADSVNLRPGTLEILDKFGLLEQLPVQGLQPPAELRLA